MQLLLHIWQAVFHGARQNHTYGVLPKHWRWLVYPSRQIGKTARPALATRTLCDALIVDCKDGAEPGAMIDEVFPINPKPK